MNNYSIWLLEYASCETQPVSSLIYGKHNAGITTIPFCFLVVKGGGHTIAIDTGYYDDGYGHELSVKFGVKRIRNIDQILTDINLNGKDFDSVILSHAHYDHMGGLRAFPNAQIYLQKKEWLDWLEVLTWPKPFSGLKAALDPNDVKLVIDLCSKGKVTLIDGTAENIFPGISVYPVFNSHTYGSQLIAIERGSNPHDRWVFTGDVCYCLENFGMPGKDDPYSPVGFGVGSITEMVQALVKIQKLINGNNDRLIICHDPSMWTVFNSKITDAGYNVAEIQLADGEKSKLTA